MGRVLSRRGFSCCFFEVAAEELSFVLAGFKLRFDAGLFEVGLLGFFEELEFFEVMRGGRGRCCGFVMGGLVMFRLVLGRFVCFGLRCGFVLAVAGDGLAGEQAAAVPLDGCVDERGGLGEAAGANRGGRLGCAGSVVGGCAAVLAERFAGEDEGNRLMR